MCSKAVSIKRFCLCIMSCDGDLPSTEVPHMEMSIFCGMVNLANLDSIFQVLTMKSIIATSTSFSCSSVSCGL